MATGTIAGYNRLTRNNKHPGTTQIPFRSYRAIGRLFLVLVVGIHAFFLWNVRERIAKADPDFTAFYTAGTLLREGRGHELYKAGAQEEVQQQFATDSDIRRGPLPYIHPAFEALLFAPLSFLAYPAAFLVWEALNLGMLVAVSLLLRSRLGSLRPVPLLEWMLALLAFFPVFTNFLQGQDAILLLLLLVLSFRALDSNSPFAAGCWLGLGVFRYHLVVPLALILGWRHRRMFSGFAASGSAAVLLSFAIVGWQAALLYPAYVLHWTTMPFFGKMPPSLMPNLLGLITGWPFAEATRGTLQVGVLAVSVLLLMSIAIMRNRANGRDFLNLTFACAVITAVLVGYNTGSYDLSLLVLPLALVADYCLGGSVGLPEATRRLVLPAVPLLVSPLWFLLWRQWERMNLMAIFLLWWLYAIGRVTLPVAEKPGGSVAPLT